MKAKNAKGTVSRAASVTKIELEGTPIPTLGRGLVLVRTSASGRIRSSARSADGAEVVVNKLGKALERPGIKRDAVFKHGAVSGIFAYSVDPKDPTKVVRESFDGSVRSGRLVGNKFKAK